MVVDRFIGQEEAFGDVRVAQTFGDVPEHFELSHRQVSGILPCCRARTARQAASPTLVQAAPDDCRRRLRAEALQLLEGAAESVLVVGVGERAAARNLAARTSSSCRSTFARCP